MLWILEPDKSRQHNYGIKSISYNFRQIYTTIQSLRHISSSYFFQNPEAETTRPEIWRNLENPLQTFIILDSTQEVGRAKGRLNHMCFVGLDSGLKNLFPKNWI